MWVLHSRWANCRARSAGHFGLVCHPCSYPEIRGWRDPQQYQPVSLMDHMIMNQGRCSGGSPSASMVYAHPAGPSSGTLTSPPKRPPAAPLSGTRSAARPRSCNRRTMALSVRFPFCRGARPPPLLGEGDECITFSRGPVPCTSYRRG